MQSSSTGVKMGKKTKLGPTRLGELIFTILSIYKQASQRSLCGTCELASVRCSGKIICLFFVTIAQINSTILPRSKDTGRARPSS